MARKTYNEKMNNSGNLPEVKDISDQPEAVKRFGGAKMLIAAPLQYNEVMEKVATGKVVTIDRVRALLASKAKADCTCPLTAGIFTNICANASEERTEKQIPWWRTLKTKGELNEKYPGGIVTQKMLLEAEGHTVIQKGKRYFVEDFEEKLDDDLLNIG